MLTNRKAKKTEVPTIISEPEQQPQTYSVGTILKTGLKVIGGLIALGAVYKVTSILFKSSQEIDANAPLLKHIKVFAGEDGYITYTSAKAAFINEFKRDEEDANNRAMGTMVAAFVKGVKGSLSGKFRPEDAVGVMNHAHDTGLYDLKGNFINEVWENLFWNPDLAAKGQSQKGNRIKLSKENDGTKIIFQSDFDAFNTQNKKVTPERWKDASIIDNFIGDFANDGEFKLYFDACASIEKLNPITGEIEKAVRLSEFKEFFLDTSIITKRIKEGTIKQNHEAQINAGLKALEQSSKGFFDKVLDKVVDCAKDVANDCPTYFPK